jgi:hypothetical protein
MSKGGNDLWWSQVAYAHSEHRPRITYKDAEIELFSRIYTQMQMDRMTQEQIRDHFEKNFGIKHTAFYRRLRKVSERYDVL